MQNRYDRAAEDVGNIVGLEHVNLRVPDQRLATLFYVTGLGLTRDPYLMTGVTNMWINVGRSQFHLPTGGPQHLRGCVGLVVPDLDGLERRLAGVREALSDTAFAYQPCNGQGFVDVTCPWGNRFHVHGASERFGRVALGMAYVMLDVPHGAADGIARFYAEVFETPAAVEDMDGAPAARVSVGAGQDLLFRESAKPVPAYDGHHIQIYIADFSGPYGRLNERGLISEESSQYQYRFRDIVDPASRALLYSIEHEVRAMTHPLFARPLVNRNPDQTNNAFAAGHETRSWSLPYDA